MVAEPNPVAFLGRVKGVSRADMAKVAGGNAERLLGIRPVSKRKVSSPRRRGPSKRKRSS